MPVSRCKKHAPRASGPTTRHQASISMPGKTPRGWRLSKFKPPHRFRVQGPEVSQPPAQLPPSRPARCLGPRQQPVLPRCHEELLTFEQSDTIRVGDSHAQLGTEPRQFVGDAGVLDLIESMLICQTFTESIEARTSKGLSPNGAGGIRVHRNDIRRQETSPIHRRPQQDSEPAKWMLRTRGSEGEVAQAVCDHTSPPCLDAHDHVGVMATDDVRAFVHQLAGEVAMPAQGIHGMFIAPVELDDYDVTLVAERANTSPQPCGVEPYRRRAAWCRNPAKMVRGSQDSDSHAVDGLQPGARNGGITAMPVNTAPSDARAVQQIAAFLESGRAKIQRMIVGG